MLCAYRVLSPATSRQSRAGSSFTQILSLSSEPTGNDPSAGRGNTNSIAAATAAMEAANALLRYAHIVENGLQLMTVAMYWLERLPYVTCAKRVGRGPSCLMQ